MYFLLGGNMPVSVEYSFLHSVLITPSSALLHQYLLYNMIYSMVIGYCCHEAPLYLPFYSFYSLL